MIAFTTGLYSGYAPIAPGTCGSALAAVLLYFLGSIPGVLHVALTAALFVGGALASERVAADFGEQDSGKIVIDEIVGILITMIGIPFTGYWVTIGFLVFRFFDITKPPPARLLDTKLKNGWGVMLDDAVAGIYGNILLHLMLRSSF
ncbi:MAG: phosphatidylglycerophosphatase A [Bdellovibrionaceae bacterium]|nr:phosphatidylglycerophosphatase A [Pseudobdellovibrionaceae bacterium]